MIWPQLKSEFDAAPALATAAWVCFGSSILIWLTYWTKHSEVTGVSACRQGMYGFLQPIANVILDPTVSEVMVNGNGSIFMQRNGALTAVDAALEPRYLTNAVKRIARSLGNDIGESKPLLDARLPDGSRVAAAFPPCSLQGVTLTIRKFRPHWFTMQQLVEAGALSIELASRLAEAVHRRKTILIAGGTDTGKTTFAKALIDFIPKYERLGVIEDTAELKIDHPNVFRFEARRAQVDGSGNVTIPAVSIRDLVKATMRHRPDRLIIGEVRAGEAFDLLDALNTGHAGSISTVHANSALQSLSRIAIWRCVPMWIFRIGLCRARSVT